MRGLTKSCAGGLGAVKERVTRPFGQGQQGLKDYWWQKSKQWMDHSGMINYCWCTALFYSLLCKLSADAAGGWEMIVPMRLLSYFWNLRVCLPMKRFTILFLFSSFSDSIGMNMFVVASIYICFYLFHPTEFAAFSSHWTHHQKQSLKRNLWRMIFVWK